MVNWSAFGVHYLLFLATVVCSVICALIYMMSVCRCFTVRVYQLMLCFVVLVNNMTV